MDKCLLGVWCCFVLMENLGHHGSLSSQAGWPSVDQMPHTKLRQGQLFQEHKPENVALLPAESCTYVFWELPTWLGGGGRAEIRVCDLQFSRRLNNTALE